MRAASGFTCSAVACSPAMLPCSCAPFSASCVPPVAVSNRLLFLPCTSALCTRIVGGGGGGVGAAVPATVAVADVVDLLLLLLHACFALLALLLLLLLLFISLQFDLLVFGGNFCLHFFPGNCCCCRLDGLSNVAVAAAAATAAAAAAILISILRFICKFCLHFYFNSANDSTLFANCC